MQLPTRSLRGGICRGWLQIAGAKHSTSEVVRQEKPISGIGDAMSAIGTSVRELPKTLTLQAVRTPA